MKRIATFIESKFVEIVFSIGFGLWLTVVMELKLLTH